MMNNLLIKPTSVWKHMVTGKEVIATHLMENGEIGLAWIEGKTIVLGHVSRQMLFENYDLKSKTS